MLQPPRTQIFRKVSLERLSSPEQLDTAMRATDPQGWIAVATLALTLLLAILWACVAYIPRKIDGNGILLRGMAMQEVFSMRAGILADVFVKPNDVVTVGQPLATMYDDATFQTMREDYILINELEKSLKTAPDAAAVGAQITRAREDVKSAQDKALREGTIVAPFAGRVVEVLAEKWDFIKEDSHVFYIEPTDVPLQALLYVSASDAGRVQVGDAVQIFPDNADREVYGCMLGVIANVSKYPSSTDDLHRKFGNDAVVAALVRGRTPVQLTVSLTSDPASPNGFKWSSGHGPQFEMRSGTLCSGSVIIGQSHPISLVIP